MNVIYEGTDITDYVNVTKCVCRDASCGRADSLDMEFDHAAAWYRWQPKEDDKIAVTLDGYDTGTMYLNTIIPEGDKFRMLATALPSAARRMAWAVYRDMTLADILHRCAVETGMEMKLYGTDGNMLYDFLLRENEGCAAFMDRLARLEGMAMKAVNGSFRGISVEYAQGRDAVQSLWIDTDQEDVVYTRQENKKISTLTVLSPHARVNAVDSAAIYGTPKTFACLPANNSALAGRWARGLLLMHNRQQERLKVKADFNPSMTALARVDVESPVDDSAAVNPAGAWIVDEVEHDLLNRISTTNLLRVISTVK